MLSLSLICLQLAMQSHSPQLEIGSFFLTSFLSDFQLAFLKAVQTTSKAELNNLTTILYISLYKVFWIYSGRPRKYE